MTHEGSVLTKIVTKFFIDETGKAKRVGAPKVSQLRLPCSVSKAADEALGLKPEQTYMLKKQGHVTFTDGGELVRFEIQSADEYEAQYQAEIAARDAKMEIK